MVTIGFEFGQRNLGNVPNILDDKLAWIDKCIGIF